MSKLSSFADYLVDWERLLRAVSTNEPDLPDLTMQVSPLEMLLIEGRLISARQLAALAQFHSDSKRRREVIAEGRAAASRLRATLRGFFGLHSERLSEFGAAPLRPRRIVLADPPTAPPPTG